MGGSTKVYWVWSSQNSRGLPRCWPDSLPSSPSLSLQGLTGPIGPPGPAGANGEKVSGGWPCPSVCLTFVPLSASPYLLPDSHISLIGHHPPRRWQEGRVEVQLACDVCGP